MNKTEALKEIVDEMRDNIRDEILSAFRAIEKLGVPDAEIASLLADQLLDILMDIFPERLPELHRRAKAMYAVGERNMYSKEAFPNAAPPGFKFEWSVNESPVDCILRQPRDVGVKKEAIHLYVDGAIGALRRFRPYASPEDQAKIDKHIAGFEDARILLKESTPIQEVER